MKVKENPYSVHSYKNGDSSVPRVSEYSDLCKPPRNGSIRRQKSRRGAVAAIRNPNVSIGKPAGSPAPSRRSRPETPLLKWRIADKKENEKKDIEGEEENDEKGSRIGRRTRREKVVMPLSARKLAAELWRLQLSESVGDRGKGELSELRPGGSHVGISFAAHHGEMSNAVPLSPCSVSGKANKSLCKLELSSLFSNSAMEGATKWDPVSLDFSDVRNIYSNTKRADQQIASTAFIAQLKSELEQARTRVHELETERRSSKKKLEQFLKKISEEKAAWRAREHEKVRAFIDDVKSDLSREKKTRHRLEIVNSKLVNELAEAKMSAKRHMQDYEKERKARELIEEVCDELAKEIGEDKAEVEALKRDAMRIKEEVDEERKMLQMAEVWREERVQMKLVDAKVALEEKYSLMNKLTADLESFLRTRSANPDQKELSEAETLTKLAASVNIQDIQNFRYDPPNPDDIFSIFECEREIELCDPPSKIHTVSPEIMTKRQEMFMEDEESGWETVSHVEDQGSSYSPEGSLPSVNNHGAAEWEENEDASTMQTKGSSMKKLWRSVSQNGESFKVISVDAVNGRKSNVSMVSIEKGGRSPAELGEEWSSPESGNSHVGRGMKGCIEWPRGSHKGTAKFKFFEGKSDGKVQLRHVLKQKM